MKEHHKAYLSKQNMTEAFFKEALYNGFDIHHIDGDHDNNEPDNLIMIYSSDHMLLHGVKKFKGRGNGVWMSQEEIDALKATQGETAYKLRLTGLMWKQIDEQLGKSTMHLAKFYAQHNNLEWPIKLSKEAADRASTYRKEKIQAKHDARVMKLQEVEDNWRNRKRL